MIYRFRIILDTEEDVFRDLEIAKTASLEDLHNAVNQSFGFDGTEIASFYLSDDEWNQGEEFSQFDMSETPGEVGVMHETILEDILSERQTKLLYVYDFLNMWRFMVELAEIAEPEDGVTYPNLMYVHGQIPDQAPDIAFEAEKDDFESEFSDDYDVDDLEDLSFDENWN
ncbi:MAG: hypothetical protein ACI828_002416 [Flavobacteriales bacterium]|jgi:hypothetical protein